MSIKITPHNQEDGGILMLPMQKNVPFPDREDWRLVSCPVCGKPCWESDLSRQVQAMEPDLRVTCTECALRAGMAREG